MKCPFVAWAGVAILLGIALGCEGKKKSTAPDSAPPPAGGPPAAGSGSVTPGKQQAGGPPAGRVQGGLYTAEGAVTPNIPASPVGAFAGTAPAKPGEIGVTVCKFDAVDSAIAAAKGKVVLIDCWATWCPPCVASFPKLVEKHQKYSEKGLTVISLSLDKATDGPAVIEFLKKNNATFTNLHLTMDRAASDALHTKFAYRDAIPHAVLLDKGGQRVWAGHPMTPDLEKKIEAELAK